MELPVSKSILRLAKRSGKKENHRSQLVSESHYLSHRKSFLKSRAVLQRHKAKCNDIMKLLPGISTIMYLRGVQAAVVLSIQRLLSNIRKCVEEVFQQLRSHLYQQFVPSPLSATFVVVNMALQASKFT